MLELKSGSASFAPTASHSQSGLADQGLAKSASDEALLALYRAGQMSAFNTLYQRYEGALYRYILGMVQRAHIASDLFQEVWVAVIQAQVSLESRPFAPWLYTVARHRVIDHLRLAKNIVLADPELEASLDEHADNDSNGNAYNQNAVHYDLADVLHNRRLGEALIRCVQSLPELQREAFILQTESDMRIEEIAQMTQSPVETIKSRLRYARNSIRKQMEGWR
jgi:RNA polymerase sigma factor (sigma-70 family)